MLSLVIEVRVNTTPVDGFSRRKPLPCRAMIVLVRFCVVESGATWDLRIETFEFHQSSSDIYG
jgi:hypothetical protein